MLDGRLLWISPNDDGDGEPPDPIPNNTNQVWFYQPHNRDWLPLYILIAPEPEGAFRIAVARLECCGGGLGHSYLCQHRLEPPCPPARTSRGEILVFGAPAAIAWAVDWIERRTAP